MYDTKVPLKNRPIPVRLTLKLEHVQMLKLNEDDGFIPAKFDETAEKQERFIVSGKGSYVFVWNLAAAVRGDTSYKFMNSGDSLIQTDFMYNDRKKMLMVGKKGITVKQNQIKEK